MFSLFIDTTQEYCNLAILMKDKIIVKSSIKTHNNLTDIVVEHINSLIKLAKLQQKDIKNILLVVGPGSFTGVRVGTIIAKTWALINKANVYQIDALLLQLPQNHGVSLLDAKGGNFYLGIYKNNKPIQKLTMVCGGKAKIIMDKYDKHDIFIQYKSVNVFDNLLFHLKQFKLIKNIENLIPLYIKKPV
jgi:tRNA threonylcarbamoyl adenosine modification protein YeaZ